MHMIIETKNFSLAFDTDVGMQRASDLGRDQIEKTK